MMDSNSLVEKKRDALRQGITEMARLTENALRASLEALRQRNLDLAKEVVDGDALINDQRRILEQQALVVLAAHQPAGYDFRMIGASLEMITEIERIADHAADVARILLMSEGSSVPKDLAASVAELGAMAAAMFQDVTAAFTQGADASKAMAAVSKEDSVDASERQIISHVTDWLCKHPNTTSAGLELLWIAHHYERIADRCTNIAERVVYIDTGDTPDLD